MANDYFNHIANRVQAGTRAIAANVNAVADEISIGLDLLPTENQLKLGLTRYAVDTGVADAYILTMPYTPTLTDGFNLTFKAVNANTGASTINVNGLGVKSIVNPDGGALIAGTFGANAIVMIAYEVSAGGRFILVSQNPAQAALAQSSAVASAASAAAALVSEGNAATSESNAAGSAGTASTDAGTATTQAGIATTQAGIATTQASAALATRLLFEQSYLGSKASNPTLDNEGNALIDGALYWNTTTNQMNVYDLGGVSWGALQDGGNAATLDTLDSTQFLRSDVDDTFTGIMTVTGQINVDQLTLNGNTISAASGAITLTAFAGSAVSVEGVAFDGGVVTGASAITATNLTGTLQTAAQANITSLGTLTNLQVDSLNLNGSVITGATSITSTTFVGALSGNATTATTAETVTTAAQPTITSVGTLLNFASTGIDDNAGSNVITLDAGLDITVPNGTFINWGDGGEAINGINSGFLNFNVTGLARLSMTAGTAGFGVKVETTTGMAVGGATAGISGIAFPATAVAVADVNTLDDYQEGEFTATCTATGGTVVFSTASDVLAYTKIGRVVHIQGDLAVDSVSGTRTTIVLNTLPFTPTDLTEVSDGAKQPIVVTGLNVSSSFPFSARILAGSTAVSLFREQGNSSENFGADVIQFTHFHVKFTYISE